MALLGHQAGSLEHGDVLLDGRKAHRVGPREARNRGLAGGAVAKDVATGRVGQGMEQPVDRILAELTYNHLVVGYRTSLPFEAGEIQSESQTTGGNAVSATVLYMSMSLDGFIAGPNAGQGNGLGDGGERLHDWLFNGQMPVFGQVFDEFMATGAIVAGRGTFEPAEGWGGDHHDGVPIWILSRREPGIDVSQWPLVTYTNDVRTAMTEAKRAAGEKNVLVHGAATAQLALAAGLLDELEIHLIPVLLGQGRRLFDNLGPEHIELQRTRILEGEDGVTHVHYRVTR